ncbi:hypothetical protein MJH12_12265 [bacterium]|nr:hypothetical protein [bacterium]
MKAFQNFLNNMKGVLTPTNKKKAFSRDQIFTLFRGINSTELNDKIFMTLSPDESNYCQVFRQVSTLLTYLSFKHNQMFFMKKEAEYEGSLGYFKVYLGFIFIDDIVFEKKHCKIYFQNDRIIQKSITDLSGFCAKFYQVQEQSILKDIINDFDMEDRMFLEILIKLSDNSSLKEDITYLLENERHISFCNVLISQGYEVLKLSKLFDPKRVLQYEHSYKAADYYLGSC